MLLLARLGTAHARDAPGRTYLVDLARPAIVKHPLVAPLVAEFLDQYGYKAHKRIVGMDRWFRMKPLDPVDDRRGILDASTLRRDHQRDDRHPGVFLVFRLARRIAQNPLMRDGFITKIGADLDRVG